MVFLFLSWILFFVPSYANAITCTGESFPFAVPTDPQSVSYTVPTVTNGITLIHSAVRSDVRTVNSVTIDGNSVTVIGTKLASADTATEVFYRLNETPGSKTITVDWDAAPLTAVITIVTCGDVTQTSPIAVTDSQIGAGFPITMDCLNTPVGSVVLDFVSNDQNSAGLTPGPGQTSLAGGFAETLSAISSLEPGGGTITMSQTGTGGDWASRCVALVPFATTRSRPGIWVLR